MKKYLVRLFRSKSLQNKMLFCLILTVILPSAIFIPALYVYQNSTIERDINSINMERSQQTSEQLEMVYEQINSVSNLYFLDSDLEQTLQEAEGTENTEQVGQLVSLLQQRYNATNQKIDMHVTIITNDDRIYGDGSYDAGVSVARSRDTWWYQHLQQWPWETLWLQDEYLDSLHGVSDPNYIYSVRLLKRFDNWENQGILIVSFLESDLAKFYANTVPSAGSEFIINQNGVLVTMMDNAGVYASGILDHLQDGYSAIYKETINGEEYQIVINTVRTPLWRVITVTPTRQMLEQYDGGTLMLPVLSGVFLLSLALFSVFVSRYIIGPIKELTTSVQRVGGAGDSLERIPVRSKDEVGDLAVEFNNMLDRIDALMATIVDEQNAKRTAELQSLYAQINPHFIYNTIASIRYLIISGESQRADDALRAFTQLLRSAITGGEELCTVQQEVSLLDEYINIQQLFFEQPFQVSWQIDQQIRSCKIIKLSLQPIVENAVMHGLKGKQGPKKLRIRIAPSGKDNILVSITDNGVGTDRVFAFDQPSNEYSKNIGLKNVHSRIVLHFGKEYGVRFHSKPGKGTTVELLFPRIESRKEVM